MKNGQGTITLPEYTYTGEFVMGLKQGKGELIKPYEKYSGEFMKGMRSGKGTLLYNNGDKYIGKLSLLMLNLIILNIINI